MKIAQVSPLTESVPPVRYGGTQRIVFYLTEELVKQGHDVSLFASADSITNARLIPGADMALGNDKDSVEFMTTHMHMMEKVVKHSNDFDLIHFHTGRMHYALARHIKTPHLTTHHSRFDTPELNLFNREYDQIPVISVSDYQQTSCPNCNWQGMVHYGIPEKLYDFSTRHDDYLAFLGKVAPDKGVLEAIEIAQRLAMPLKIAGKIEREDQDFFDRFVKPHLLDPRIEYVGEINNTIKNYFLGDAYALLVSEHMAKPFEIVAIEALACGTPVVAFDHGAIGEIIQHGENGYLVDGIDSAVKAVKELDSISRLTCRQSFEKRFTAKHMVNSYINIYKSILTDIKIQLKSGHDAVMH